MIEKGETVEAVTHTHTHTDNFLEDNINKIINDDCLNVMKQLPDKCIDLILTDPPYGIKMDGGKIGGDHKGIIAKEYTKKEWDSKIPPKEYFEEMFRVAKKVIIFGGNYFVDYLHSSSCWLVWDKKNTGNFADCELAYTNFDTAVRKYEYMWNGMLQQNMKHKEVRIHPTQKPVGLFTKILLDYSKENDIVMDCFSGSGTTAIACHKTKRKFICVEKDKEYFESSLTRLEEEQSQLNFF